MKFLYREVLHRADRDQQKYMRSVIRDPKHPDYGKYFDSDSIATLIEKVEAGTATYESLFESVKALYGIINQIIPQS